MALPTAPSESVRKRSARGSGLGLILAGVVTVAACGGAAYFYDDLVGMLPVAGPVRVTGFQTYTVQSKRMTVSVTEDGEVESASNVLIKCQVEDGSQIINIVPEGEYVTPGTVLVKLNEAPIKTEINRQEIAYATAKSAEVKAKEDFGVAEIGIREYQKGTFIQEKQLAEANIVVAEENLRDAQAALEHNQRMFRKGYLPKQQLESSNFAVERCQLELAQMKTALNVLVEYTREKMVKELTSARDAAEAALEAAKAATELEKDKLDLLKKQLDACTIVAPQEGMVIYANNSSRRGGSEPDIQEGAPVRYGQDMIKLPDLNQLQVSATVHERRVNDIEVGMPARIQVRSLNGRGEVTSVSNQPEPGSWFSSSVKEYKTLVSIDDPSQLPGLKPGMTASVTIVIKDLEDVVAVPLLGVVESGSRHYCYLVDDADPKGYVERPVKIGAVSDKEIQITDGLAAGDEVILNPRAKIPEARIDEAAVKKPAGGPPGAPGGAGKPAGGKPAGGKPQGKPGDGKSGGGKPQAAGTAKAKPARAEA